VCPAESTDRYRYVHLPDGNGRLARHPALFQCCTWLRRRLSLSTSNNSEESAKTSAAWKVFTWQMPYRSADQRARAVHYRDGCSHSRLSGQLRNAELLLDANAATASGHIPCVTLRPCTSSRYSSTDNHRSATLIRFVHAQMVSRSIFRCFPQRRKGWPFHPRLLRLNDRITTSQVLALSQKVHIRAKTWPTVQRFSEPLLSSSTTGPAFAFDARRSRPL
jgi:hypothetical protein